MFCFNRRTSSFRSMPRSVCKVGDCTDSTVIRALLSKSEYRQRFRHIHLNVHSRRAFSVVSLPQATITLPQRSNERTVIKESDTAPSTPPVTKQRNLLYIRMCVGGKRRLHSHCRVIEDTDVPVLLSEATMTVPTQIWVQLWVVVRTD